MALAAPLAPGVDVEAGLADPVRNSQRIFRTVLDAMAHPGRLETLPALVAGAVGLSPAATAICLALVDFETPIWLDEVLAGPGLMAFLRFHTGAALADGAETARFALLDGPSTDLKSFHTGSDAYPEEGATVIIQVPGLSDNGPLILSGPGIDGTRRFGAEGLPDSFWRERAIVNGGFPRGIDLILCAGHRIAALPRTTEVLLPGTEELR
jgi:alpha-D-ribose 1-methylphosphonate 5-triphosphate synthase subunit PhnH